MSLLMQLNWRWTSTAQGASIIPSSYPLGPDLLYRFLQNALETATPSERHDVFLAVLSSAQQLTTDPFGNYVIQKLFDHLPEEHIVTPKIDRNIISTRDCD